LGCSAPFPQTTTAALMSQSSEDEDGDFMDGESSEEEEAESLIDEEDEEDDFQDKKKPAKKPTKRDNVAPPGQAAASKKSKPAAIPKEHARKPASNAAAATAKPQPAPSSVPARTPAAKTAPSSAPVNTPAAKTAVQDKPTKPPSTAPKMTIGGVEQRVCEYLLVQNRPYNAIMITENLHKTIPKSHIEKVLEALSAKGTLVCKEVGKQKIYYPNQEQFDTPDEDTMRSMLETANTKSEEAKALRKENDVFQAEVKSLENELDDDALSAKIEELETETAQLRSRLEEIQGTGQACTAQDKEKIVKQYTAMRTEWKKRKRQVMDGINQMCDSMETVRPKDLMGKMGIELDEEWKVQLGDDKIGPKRRK